jgi:lipid II isoglutaminyl synthase (glutamine-hydrolysing)
VSHAGSANGRPDLVLVHLYPDLLRTYGDRGNVLTLVKRAEWRGFRVEVAGVTRGESIPERANLIFMGGGTDRIQEIIGVDLRARRPALEEAAAKGAVVIGVCGGYQFLGAQYVDVAGASIEGLGLLDISTVAGRDRIIGNVRAQASIDERSFELFGFENHAGRTTLGALARPLAAVPRGRGNNGDDGTEGAVQGTVVGTYLHGPVLPVNPALADVLLEWALAGRLRGEPLAPLDDSLEDEAQLSARSRKR